MKDMIGQELSIDDYIITKALIYNNDLCVTQIQIIINDKEFIAINPISETTNVFYSYNSFKISPSQTCLAKIFDPERFKTL